MIWFDLIWRRFWKRVIWFDLIWMCFQRDVIWFDFFQLFQIKSNHQNCLCYYSGFLLIVFLEMKSMCKMEFDFFFFPPKSNIRVHYEWLYFIMIWMIWFDLNVFFRRAWFDLIWSDFQTSVIWFNLIWIYFRILWFDLIWNVPIPDKVLWIR